MPLGNLASKILSTIAEYLPPDGGLTPRLPGWNFSKVICLITALAVLVFLGMDKPSNPVAKMIVEEKANGVEPYYDRHLYRDIAHAVASGEPYYVAAPRLQRAHDYPVHPFPTVRLPTFSYLWASLGDTTMQFSYFGLIVLTLLVWWRMLSTDCVAASPTVRPAAILLLLMSIEPNGYALHECWAGLLAALSVATYRNRKPALAIILALAATLIRETMLPFLIALTFFSIIHRRNVFIAIVPLSLVIVVVIFHAITIHAIPALPTDFVNTGWVRMNGWSTYVYFIQQTTILYALPYSIAAISVPFALLGWLGWRTPVGIAGAALHMGFAILFMFIGRPENIYWGYLLAPTILIGLLNVPGTVKEIYLILKSRAINLRNTGIDPLHSNSTVGAHS